MQHSLPKGTQIRIEGRETGWGDLVGRVLTANNWGREDQSDWYIELKLGLDGNGEYRYWKQGMDGGTLRVTSCDCDCDQPIYHRDTCISRT